MGVKRVRIADCGMRSEGKNRRDLKVTLGGLELQSPVVMASGTFGYGTELAGLVDYRKIGAVTTKTVTLRPRPGNPQPRIWEVVAGTINCIGLQNPGVEVFLRDVLPRLRRLGTKVIVSVAGCDNTEIAAVAEMAAGEKIAAVELNVSCPNLKGEVPVSQNPRLTLRAVQAAKKKTGRCPLIVKLSPNVTDISAIARAAEEGGADILCLVNTVKALAVDWEAHRVIAGGLSGPAIKPIGLRAVFDVYRAVRIPLIGMGGIASGQDALDYLGCGASAVGIGSAGFADPLLASRVYDFLKNHMIHAGLRRIGSLAGTLHGEVLRNAECGMRSETRRGKTG